MTIAKVHPMWQSVADMIPKGEFYRYVCSLVALKRACEALQRPRSTSGSCACPAERPVREGEQASSSFDHIQL